MAEDQNQNSNSTNSGADAEVSEVETYKAQAEKFKNDYLYLRAEFENYKRNAIKERSELIKYGNERLLVDLLGVLDNFERALETKATPENLSTYVKGIEMTAQEFRQALLKNGVTEVASQGAAFDPNMHEALSSEETDDVKPGHISRVFKKAYRLHDRVLRPGQVVVAKTQTKN